LFRSPYRSARLPVTTKRMASAMFRRMRAKSRRPFLAKLNEPRRAVDTNRARVKKARLRTALEQFMQNGIDLAFAQFDPCHRSRGRRIPRAIKFLDDRSELMFGKSLPMRCRIVPKLPLRIGDVPIGLFEPLQQPLADFDVGTDLQQEVVARLAEPGGPV